MIIVRFYTTSVSRNFCTTHFSCNLNSDQIIKFLKINLGNDMNNLINLYAEFWENSEECVQWEPDQTQKNYRLFDQMYMGRVNTKMV